MDIPILLIAILAFIFRMMALIAEFGTSAIIVPTRVYFLPLQVVLLLTGIIHLFNDGGRFLSYRDGICRKRMILSANPLLIIEFRPVFSVELNVAKIRLISTPVCRVSTEGLAAAKL